MQPLSKPRGRGWNEGEIKAVTLGNEVGTSNNVAWKFITVNTGASPGYDRCKTSDCSSSFEIRRGKKGEGNGKVEGEKFYLESSLLRVSFVKVELETWNQFCLLGSRRKEL